MKPTKLILPILCSIVIVGFILYRLEVFPGLASDSGSETFVDEYENKVQENEEVIATDEGTEKEQIVMLILESAYYFDNVQGKYTLHTSGGEETEKVNFAVDMVNKKAMVHRQKAGKEVALISYGDTKEHLRIQEDEKTYQYTNWSSGNNDEEPESYSTYERLFYGYGKDPDINNLTMDFVTDNPYVSSLKLFADWEFEETVFMDLPSYQINGVDSHKENGDKFEMIVEKNTGLLLYYQLFNTDGEEMISLTTDSIQIDEGIDQSVFERDISGYEKYEIPDYVPEEYLPDNDEEDER